MLAGVRTMVIMKLTKLFLSLLVFFSSFAYAENESVGDQLWVMVKIDTYFRSKNELSLVDDINELIEGSNLGSLDGHSSGAYQFDFNFYEIGDFNKAKSTIESFIDKQYPNLTYTIEETYGMPYERL